MARARALIAAGGERRVALAGDLGGASKPSSTAWPLARSSSRVAIDPVAAVAAGAAEHGDPAARLREPRGVVGDPEPSPLHERDARRSRRNRKAIALLISAGVRSCGNAKGSGMEPRGARGSRRGAKGQKRPSHRAGFCYIAPHADPR